MAKTNKDARIRVKLKAYDHRVIDQSVQQILDTAIRTGAKIAGPIPLPTRIERYTVLSSPHVHKRGGTQLESRTHNRLIDILEPTRQTIDSLSHLNLPTGVGIEIKM